MKILEYHYREMDGQGWTFAKVQFGNMNLLVGDSATGKTRLLNTIFNLGRFVGVKEFKHGSWDIVFEHAGIKYSWQIQTCKKGENEDSQIIVHEELIKEERQKRLTLVERNEKDFLFNNQKMPKLSPRETSISLLKEEEIIHPIYQAFSRIQRRLFSQDALSKVSEYQVLPRTKISQFRKKRELEKLFVNQLNISANLFLLSQNFKPIYQEIISYYKQVFPFIREVRLTELSEFQPHFAVAGHCPVFAICERGSSKWIPVNDFSSGMQKVLLILTDIFILPDGGIYIIDEYENSLGIGAIDFFPQLILDLEKKVQFFVTSHHPYLINNIPPDNWFVFRRHGMHVSILHGEELVKRFGKSSQKAFIQLINDPWFSEGVQ